MDIKVKKFIRKWIKIPQTSNIDIMFHSKGGAVQLPSYLYDHGHIIAESNPQDEVFEDALNESKEAPKNLRLQHQECVRTRDRKKNLAIFKNKHAENITANANSLLMQGEWSRLFELQSSDVKFSSLCKGLSEATYRFLIRSSNNSLPTASYLQKINPRISGSCIKCGNDLQTLHHVLVNCPQSLENGLYTFRHNKVLNSLKTFIENSIGENYELLVDLPDSMTSFTIPPNIMATELRPDISIINRQNKEMTLVELTVCWDRSSTAAEARKSNKYAPLVSELGELGWNAKLLTIEIGCRGYTTNENAMKLKQLIKSKAERTKLLIQVNQDAITTSYIIYINRNNKDFRPN